MQRSILRFSIWNFNTVFVTPVPTLIVSFLAFSILFHFCYYYYYLSSGGWGKITVKLTTLQRIFIHVVCRFNIRNPALEYFFGLFF